MSFRVWMECPVLESEASRLAEHAELVQNREPDGVRGCQAAIITARPQVDGAFLDAAPELCLVVRHGIGYDNVDVRAATERGVLVANTPDGPTESTAEHTVLLIMAAARRLLVADRQIRGKTMDRAQMKGLELRGKTLGVVGAGRIGARVAEICGRGLGMNVLSYDPYAKAAPPGARLVADLDELLAAADVVSVNCALTDETRGMISEARLRRMKKGAVIVNAGRGPLVDEDALLRVLKEGHLSAAGLDVFHVEPPLATHPLLALDNVVATPHIASFTDGGSQKMSSGSVDQVLHLIRSQRPPNLVNPEAWPGRAKGLLV
jgi:D-3-phosphoglycerate dehydrogenase